MNYFALYLNEFRDIRGQLTKQYLKEGTLTEHNIRLIR